LAKIFFFIQGKCYRLIIQTRVNPAEIVVVKSHNLDDDEYWLLPAGGNDLRPYGICVFPMDDEGDGESEDSGGDNDEDEGDNDDDFQ
jgi:hypothetical protein